MAVYFEMKLCLEASGRIGYIYLPPYTMFLWGIDSLLQGTVYTCISRRLDARIRSVKGNPQFQPLRVFLVDF
jgi:hypothetical protein